MHADAAAASGLRAVCMYVWAALSIVVLASPHVPVLVQLAAHGRLRKSSAATERFKAMASLTVPKRLFLHFYVVGAALVAAAWWALEQQPRIVESMLHLVPASLDPPLDPLCRVALALVAAHLTRRVAECALVVEWGSARMHLAGYALGVGHYALLALSLFVDAAHFPRAGSRLNESTSVGQWCRVGIGVAAFAGASVLQHWSARTIARLRRERSARTRPAAAAAKARGGAAAPQVYVVPRGGAFELLVAPHLTAEVAIYAALALVAGDRLPLLRWVAVWVASNQAISARSARQWYVATFGDAFPHERWTLVPYLW